MALISKLVLSAAVAWIWIIAGFVGVLITIGSGCSGFSSYSGLPACARISVSNLPALALLLPYAPEAMGLSTGEPLVDMVVLPGLTAFTLVALASWLLSAFRDSHGRRA